MHQHGSEILSKTSVFAGSSKYVFAASGGFSDQSLEFLNIDGIWSNFEVELACRNIVRAKTNPGFDKMIVKLRR
jgi:hypothetical protein